MSLRDYSDDELNAEVVRRASMACPTCRKWQAYIGVYDSDGNTLRCHGCLRAVARCTCR